MQHTERRLRPYLLLLAETPRTKVVFHEDAARTDNSLSSVICDNACRMYEGSRSIFAVTSESLNLD